MIRDYYERMGVEVVATITGDGRVDAIRRAHGASSTSCSAPAR